MLNHQRHFYSAIMALSTGQIYIPQVFILQDKFVKKEDQEQCPNCHTSSYFISSLRFLLQYYYIIQLMFTSSDSCSISLYNYLLFLVSKNDRMASVGRPLRDHLLQPPRHGSDASELDLAAQSLIKPGLAHTPREKVSMTSLGSPFQSLATLIPKNFC